MALSRFWLTIISVSIIYILCLLAFGSSYSIDNIVNGKKDDPILVKEAFKNKVPQFLQDTLTKSSDHKYTTASGDTTYLLENGTVKINKGKLATDGILPTCKNTIIDLLLPLVAYLSFFCGILQLLIDSGASEKLAKFLNPVFAKIFPDIPPNHPKPGESAHNFERNGKPAGN